MHSVERRRRSADVRRPVASSRGCGRCGLRPWIMIAKRAERISRVCREMEGQRSPAADNAVLESEELSQWRCSMHALNSHRLTLYPLWQRFSHKKTGFSQ